MRGISGKTLPCTEIPEVLGPAMMGMCNSTKKVRNLPGGRPNQGITHTQVVGTVGAAFTTLTERRLVDSKIDDTIDVEIFHPDMAVVMSPARQACHERGEEGILEENAILSTRSYPGE